MSNISLDPEVDLDPQESTDLIPHPPWEVDQDPIHGWFFPSSLGEAQGVCRWKENGIRDWFQMLNTSNKEYI